MGLLGTVPECRGVVTAVALLNDPVSWKGLAAWVDTRARMANPDSEQTWLPLLALGEASGDANSGAAGPIQKALTRRWTGNAAEVAIGAQERLRPASTSASAAQKQMDVGGGWVKRLRAVEAHAHRSAGGDAHAGPSNEGGDPEPAVRWTALCLQAGANELLARTLGLPGPGSVRRRIDARGFWHSTGVTLAAGARVRLAAWGAWRLARQDFEWTDPDGYDPAVEVRLLRTAELEKLKQERFPRMSLEGRLGTQCFRIGRCRTITSKLGGELLVRAWVPLGDEDASTEGTPTLAWCCRPGRGRRRRVIRPASKRSVARP